MATNYGYVKRDPEDRINWADVGTSVSNRLKDEIERRDTLKQSIKEELFTLPQTDNDLLKTEALNFANIVSQQRLSQDRRLQDGSLNLRDYTVERQNLGNTQQLMSKFTKDKVQYDAEFAKQFIESGVGFAAKEYKLANEDGLSSVDDAWQNKNFQNSIGDYLKAQLVNPDATSAILGTYLTGYEYEYLDGTIGGKNNPKGTGGNNIPLRRNSRGVWEFDQDSEQGKILKKVVSDKLLEQVRGKMDRKETDFSVSDKISKNTNYKESRAENESIIQTGKIFNGNEQEIKDALVYFEGKNAVKYNLLSTDGSTLTLSSTDKNGNITEFTLDRSKGMTPTSFLTQASTQFGGFDLGNAKNSKAFKSWAVDNQGVMSTPSLVSDEISFGAQTRTTPKFEDTLQNRTILGDDEKLEGAINKFKKEFKSDKTSAIENEFINFGFSDSSVELIEPAEGSYGVDYIKINIPGTTSMPLLINNNTPEAQVVKLINKLENNKKQNKPPMTQNEVNKLVNGTNIMKTVYGKTLGIDSKELEEQWNGGDGVPSTSSSTSSNTNTSINGANYNTNK